MCVALVFSTSKCWILEKVMGDTLYSTLKTREQPNESTTVITRR